MYRIAISDHWPTPITIFAAAKLHIDCLVT